MPDTTTEPGAQPGNTRQRGRHLLTDAEIRGALRGPDRALPDGGALYLRVRNGHGKWYLREVVPATGKRTWAPLYAGGEYPERTLRQARIDADAARQATAAGAEDLVRRRQREAAEQAAAEQRAAAEQAQLQTVRQVFDTWVSIELQPRQRGNGRRAGRRDGGEGIRGRWDLHVFPYIGDRVMAEVTKADLMAVMDRTSGGGKHRTTGLMLQEMKQFYTFALLRDIVDRHPLMGVTAEKVGGEAVERDRALSDDEVRALIATLPGSGLNARSQAALLLILATGVRVGELLGAAWADVLQPSDDEAAALGDSWLAVRAGIERDLIQRADESRVKFGTIDTDAGRWYLPDTKNGRDHTIHLSAFALEQIEKLRALRDPLQEGEAPEDARFRRAWVFPARDHRHRQGLLYPVTAPSLGKQITDRQRAPDDKPLTGRSKATATLTLPGGHWTLHDLRRTAGTLMARLGVSSDVIDEALNHKAESKIRRIYIRDRREAEQAEAFDKLGAKLAELSRPPAEPSNADTGKRHLRRVA